MIPIKKAKLREIRSSLNKLALIEAAIQTKKESLLAEWEDLAGPIADQAKEKFHLNMNIQPMDSRHEPKQRTIGTN